MEKAKVFKIQGVVKRDVKSVKRASSEVKNAKSFKIKIPRKVPPKRDKSTFFV